MFKRIMLTLTFAAAVGAAGLCLPGKAEARRWVSGRPYVTYDYGPRAYYGYGVPYRTYYRGYYSAEPYRYSYGYPGYYYNGPRVGVRVGPIWR